MASHFDWIDFYGAFADSLLKYKDNRSGLVDVIKRVYDKIGMPVPKIEADDSFVDIDPFSVFAFFNKGLTEKNRVTILEGFASELGISTPVPTSFPGVPNVSSMKAVFFCWLPDRGDDDIDNLWGLFETALAVAEGKPEKEQFCELFDKVIKQKGIRWNITLGLFWIRPESFISLDVNNRKYIRQCEGMDSRILDLLQKFEKKDLVTSGKEYLEFCDLFKDLITKGKNTFNSFPEFSLQAWESGDAKNGDRNGPLNQRFWLYAPGTNAEAWEDCRKNCLMVLGWDEMGDISHFASREAIIQKMKEIYGGDSSFKNDSLAVWQFVNEIKPGDVVFAKKGRTQIIGRGVVEGGYNYNPTRQTYHNERKIRWENVGTWPHPDGLAGMKVLTDITKYPNYVAKLNKLVDGKESPLPQSPGNTDVQESGNCDEYDKDGFLNEVFIDGDRYDTLVAVLQNKKNVILQGAPGVGKTFAARRLAWSIMGEKDNSRIEFVQFHQNYSYEDFVMGYRPSGDGFALREGIFYRFCKKAESLPDKDFFFIIDEINRGNLSKIFGELLMLIERDYRETETTLAYDGEPFSVPKNLHIIGMMNTADRSLAMIDYALRRRFSFFDMNPGFDSDGFKAYQKRLGNKKFDSLVSTIKELNREISQDRSLGKGFCIGHSYLCLDDDGKCTDAWLQSVVEYDIIQMLQEYWFDDAERLMEWSEKLREAVR